MNESPIFQDDKNDNEVEVPPVVDVNIDEDDLGVSEVNLDDDDDIFWNEPDTADETIESFGEERSKIRGLSSPI